MATEHIPLMDLKAQYLSIKGEIDAAMQSVLQAGMFVGGAPVTEFENAFAKAIGIQNCVGCGNGTDAIFLALTALGIGAGDEVATVANTFIATAEAISMTGARPVFIDCDPKTYNIDIVKLENVLAQSRKIKAIVPVHLYGSPADMPAIMSLASRYNIKVVEDCAQAHLAQINGQNVGTFGHLSTFSFYPGKNLGAYGDAGAVLSRDAEVAKRVRMWANHGRVTKYDHAFEGINSRLDTLQAAILSVKLKYLPDWTNKRIEKATLYSKLLSDSKNIICPEVLPRARHVFHLYVVRVQNRDRVLAELNEAGIQALVHYPIALPMMKAYEYLKTPIENFPMAKQCQDEVLSLPLYPELSASQIHKVCEKLREAVGD